MYDLFGGFPDDIFHHSISNLQYTEFLIKIYSSKFKIRGNLTGKNPRTKIAFRPNRFNNYFVVEILSN